MTHKARTGCRCRAVADRRRSPATAIYATADGRWLTVAALEPKFFARLCELIGRAGARSAQCDAGQERCPSSGAVFRSGRWPSGSSSSTARTSAPARSRRSPRRAESRRRRPGPRPRSASTPRLAPGARRCDRCSWPRPSDADRPEPAGPRLLVSRGGAVVSRRPRGRRARGSSTAHGTPRSRPPARCSPSPAAATSGSRTPTAAASGRSPATPKVVGVGKPSWAPGGRDVAYTARGRTASGRSGCCGCRSARRTGSSPAATGVRRRCRRTASGLHSSPHGAARPAVYVAQRRRRPARRPFDASRPASRPPTCTTSRGRRTGAGSRTARTRPDGTTRDRRRRRQDADAARRSATDAPGLVARRTAARIRRRRRPAADAGSRRDAVSVDVGAGAPLDWQRVPLGPPEFPDLVQRPPSGLVVAACTAAGSSASRPLVDNRGPGSSGSTAAGRPDRR